MAGDAQIIHRNARATWLRAAFCLAAALVMGAVPVGPHARSSAASNRADTSDKADTTDKDAKTPAKPPEAAPAPAYEPKLLRLSGMLGALAYLQDLCGHHHDGQIWRQKMSALLDAEAKTSLRKERLAGAFNRGFRGYALTYRLCTPNAQAIISRFLEESGKLARDVVHRYGPS